MPGTDTITSRGTRVTPPKALSRGHRVFYIVSSWFLARNATSGREGGGSSEEPGRRKGVHDDGLVWQRRFGFARIAWDGRFLACPARADRVASCTVAARQRWRTK